MVDDISSYLLDLISSVGMTVVNNEIPTRFSSNSKPSLLDLLLLSHPQLLLLYDQISFVSDNDLQFCTCNIRLNTDDNLRLITYRDYGLLNVSSLFADVSNLSWNECWYHTTVDEKLGVFLTTLQSVYDLHIPERSFHIRNCSCPWYTSAVKYAIRNRNLAYDAWKRNPTSANRAIYKRLRNCSNLAVRQAKKSYYSRKLDINLPTSQLWKNIKSVGVHSCGSYDCKLDPDELNDSFCVNNPIINPKF